MKPTLLIMAAGLGSRYGSLKQIDPVGPSGEAIIDYSVFDAIKAGFGRIVFVIRKNIESDFKATLLKRFEKFADVDYVFQELDMLPPPYQLPVDRIKPWGTAHAILVASDKVHTPFAAINADDFYGLDAFRKMAAQLQNQGMETDYSMVGYELEKTLSEHGSVSRGVCSQSEEEFLTAIQERTKIRREDNKLVFEENGQKLELDQNTIVSMNFWGFTPTVFQQIEEGFSKFLHQNISDPKSEYYIPTLIDELISSGRGSVKILTSSSRWFGVTYREDKEMVVNEIKKLVDRGDYPVNLWK